MITLDSIQGHWVRRWIKAPGFHDETTRVHWMQVGSLFADVRIPAERPDLTGYRALSEVPVSALRQLAQAEGFAGVVELDGQRCTWHRDINWHGTPETVDVGEISFDADGRMVEQGVHADYRELWEQHASPATGRAYRASGEGYQAFLVVRDERFVLGVGRPEKPSTSRALEALAGEHVETDMAPVFDGVHAVGQLIDGEAIAALATQPFAEGGRVLTLEGDRLTWHRIGFDGETEEVGMQLNEMVVASGTA